ncbi:hypothetical protein MRX96_040051 [Rhipicephalus microplus]
MEQCDFRCLGEQLQQQKQQFEFLGFWCCRVRQPQAHHSTGEAAGLPSPRVARTSRSSPDAGCRTPVQPMLRPAVTTRAAHRSHLQSQGQRRKTRWVSDKHAFLEELNGAEVEIRRGNWYLNEKLQTILSAMAVLCSVALVVYLSSTIWIRIKYRDILHASKRKVYADNADLPLFCGCNEMACQQ